MNKLIELRRAYNVALFTAYRRCSFVNLRFCRPPLGERREGDCEAAMVGGYDWLRWWRCLRRADSDHFVVTAIIPRN